VEPELLSRCQLGGNAISVEAAAAVVAAEAIEIVEIVADVDTVAALEGAAEVAAETTEVVAVAAAAAATDVKRGAVADEAGMTESEAARVAVTAAAMAAAAAAEEGLVQAAVAEGAPLPPPLALTRVRGLTPGRGWTKYTQNEIKNCIPTHPTISTSSAPSHHIHQIFPTKTLQIENSIVSLLHSVYSL